VASSSWRNGSADSDDGDDARSDTTMAAIRAAAPMTGLLITGIERRDRSTEHGGLIDQQLLA